MHIFHSPRLIAGQFSFLYALLLPNSIILPNPQNHFIREDCECTPVRFFVILSMQRSGSGWFETLLNSHPNISSNGEVFSSKTRRQSIETVQRTLDTVYNLEWVSSAAKNECVAAVGFKWMLNQVWWISACLLCSLSVSLLAKYKALTLLCSNCCIYQSSQMLVSSEHGDVILFKTNRRARTS